MERGQKKKEKKEERDTSRKCLSGVEVGF